MSSSSLKPSGEQPERRIHSARRAMRGELSPLIRRSKAKSLKIGVFDSGVGGQSVAEAITKALPEAEVTYREDKANVPYGNKTPEQLLKLVTPILQAMVQEGCEVIVVACNTVTTTIINKLRGILSVPLVGMEPMVKPAAEMSKSGVIAICATPATLGSERYKWLKEAYAKNVKVLEPDCSDWAYMIENNQVDHQKIKRRTEEVCNAGADVIVLGCTHYHWIEEEIKQTVNGRAQVIQPIEPVIKQLRKVLTRQP